MINKAATIEKEINAATVDDSTIRSAMAELALVVQAVWARIGYQGEPPREAFDDEPSKGVIGEIGRYGDQGTRGWGGKDTRAKQDRLLAEHVVPRAWIQAFVRIFLKINMTKAEDSRLYQQMTTIMIYVGAARYKTAKSKRTDNVVINKLKN